MRKRNLALVMASLMLLTSFSAMSVNAGYREHEIELVGIVKSFNPNPVDPEPTITSDSYAVIVGISDYPGYQNDLPSPATEAKNMKDTLCSKGWMEENMVLLTNAEATRQGILDALDWLSQKTGTVLFYFSGHGTQVKDTSGDESGIDFLDEAIVPYECTISSFILDDELADIVAGFKAEEIVLIFISCFSGGMAEKGTVSISKEKFLKAPLEELQGENRVIIAACQEGLTTYELPLFGQPVAKYLRKSFSGEADLNNDGKVTAEEAFEYTQPRAMLEMAVGLKYPMVIIATIKAWIAGEVTLFGVIYVLTVLGLMLPIPQMFDGNPSSDIVITEISSTSLDRSSVHSTDFAGIGTKLMLSHSDGENVDDDKVQSIDPISVKAKPVLLEPIKVKPIEIEDAEPIKAKPIAISRDDVANAPSTEQEPINVASATTVSDNVKSDNNDITVDLTEQESEKYGGGIDIDPNEGLFVLPSDIHNSPNIEKVPKLGSSTYT